MALPVEHLALERELHLRRTPRYLQLQQDFASQLVELFTRENSMAGVGTVIVPVVLVLGSHATRPKRYLYAPASVCPSTNRNWSCPCSRCTWSFASFSFISAMESLSQSMPLVSCGAWLR